MQRRVIGLVLVILGVGWLAWAQLLVWSLPTAIASEAPDRHLAGRDTFSKKEAYGLSLDVARDFQHSLPNVLWPIAPILLGSYLLMRGAREKK
jgi:hypothetical protein